jgi:hypothetical protein
MEDHAEGYDEMPGEAAQPAQGVAELLAALRGYQHLDDPGVVWFVLALAVGSFLDGDPTWGMVVGAPSGGKTEAIRLPEGLAEHLDELTTAGLLGWQKTKNGQGRQTGALVRIGERGLIVISDFSTVLATSDRGGRDQLFASLRRIYDGSFVRSIGTAPEPLVWKGRATLIAGVTPAIDTYSSHGDALGPRWLYYRMADQDSGTGRKRARRAQKAAPEIEARRAAARKLAADLIRTAARVAPGITLPADMAERLIDLAIVVGLGRGAVPRHGYGRREIDGLATVESPPRLTLQLTTLARCLLALGLDQESALSLCWRAALSSMPDIRRRVLTELAGGEELTVSEIARRTGAHRHPTRFALEELEVIGVSWSEEQEEDSSDRFPSRRPWRLDGEDAVLVAEVMAAHSWHEKWGPPPEPPEEGSGVDGIPHVSCQGAPDDRPAA